LLTRRVKFAHPQLKKGLHPINRCNPAVRIPAKSQITAKIRVIPPGKEPAAGISHGREGFVKTVSAGVSSFVIKIPGGFLENCDSQETERPREH
jgi:hypothetical protein